MSSQSVFHRPKLCEMGRRGVDCVSHINCEHPAGHVYVIVSRCADGRCNGCVAPLLDSNFALRPHQQRGGRHIDQAQPL